MTVVLHRVRTCYWGALYITDAEEYDFDAETISGPGPVWAADRHVAVGTAHLRAVLHPDDAVVELFIRVRDEPLAECGYDVVIEVPSGVVNIGDADESDDVPLGPPGRRWRVQIDVDDPVEARRVEITLSPAEDPSP